MEAMNTHEHECPNCGRTWQHENRSRLACNGGPILFERIEWCWPCRLNRMYGQNPETNPRLPCHASGK